MLPFYYTFLILVLSSVPAWPIRPRQDPGVTKLLMYNKNERLWMGLWGRVKVSAAEDAGDMFTGNTQMTAAAAEEEEEAEEEGEASTWTDNYQYLDDTLRFVPGTGPRAGVETVELRRIVRELLPNKQRSGPARRLKQNQYRVVRAARDHGTTTQGRPAKTLALLDPPSLPIINCRSYLHDTYWGRNPKILGSVSYSLMIWKS